MRKCFADPPLRLLTPVMQSRFICSSPGELEGLAPADVGFGNALNCGMIEEGFGQSHLRIMKSVVVLFS